MHDKASESATVAPTDDAGESAAISPDAYRGWLQVAVVENDRYCLMCGYNLRTQPVRRQPVTELLVTRCPECAKFTAVSEPAAVLRPWTRRLISLAVVFWVGFLLAVFAWAVGGSVAMHLISLEERLTYSRFTLPTPTPVAPAPMPQLASRPTTQAMVLQALQAAGQTGQTVQLGAGGLVSVQPTRPRLTFTRHIIENPREYWGIKFLMIFLAMLIAFVAATIVLVAMPHWPKLANLLVFCLAPIIPAGIAWLIWREDKPQFLDWGTVEILHTLVGQVLAGLLAAMLGRGPVRLLALVFLPSRLRAALAYLWIVDGKAPPVGRSGAS